MLHNKMPTRNLFLHSSDTMTEEQPPLTEPFFATEEESNITASPHQASDTPSSEVENSLAATDSQEHTTHNCTPQLLSLETANVCVLIAPNINFSYPCEDGEVECAHNGGDPLGGGCNTITENPPLPREGGASDTPEHSNEVENNLGATDTHGHTTHHYVPLLLPLETANVCVFIAPNVNCSHPCEDGEVECAHNGAVPLEDGGSECNTITENPTPPTQQFVSGRIVSRDVT